MTAYTRIIVQGEPKSPRVIDAETGEECPVVAARAVPAWDAGEQENWAVPEPSEFELLGQILRDAEARPGDAEARRP